MIAIFPRLFLIAGLCAASAISGCGEREKAPGSGAVGKPIEDGEPADKDLPLLPDEPAQLQPLGSLSADTLIDHTPSCRFETDDGDVLLIAGAEESETSRAQAAVMPMRTPVRLEAVSLGGAQTLRTGGEYAGGEINVRIEGVDAASLPGGGPATLHVRLRGNRTADYSGRYTCAD